MRSYDIVFSNTGYLENRIGLILERGCRCERRSPLLPSVHEVTHLPSQESGVSPVTRTMEPIL